MSVATPSRADMRRWVGALGGWLVGGQTYAPVGTPSPSLLYSQETPWVSDDQPTGLTFYVTSGAASGQERLVASHTAGLGGSGSLYRFDRAFASTPSTNSVFELWNGPNIAQAHRAIESAVQAAQLRVLLPHEQFAGKLGDVIPNGAFGRWSNGASAAPDGWTLTGTDATVARETLRWGVYAGAYSANLVNGSSQAAYLQTDDLPLAFENIGKTITVKANVYATLASRVRIEVTDGVNTTYSNYHDGEGGWFGQDGGPLTVEHEVSNDATGLKVSLRIEAGSVMSARWGRVGSDGLSKLYRTDLASDLNFAAIGELLAESPTTVGVFNTPIPQTDGHNIVWTVEGADNDKHLAFTRYADPFMGRAFKIVGQRYPQLPTSDDGAIEVDPEYVRLRSAIELTDMLGGPSDGEMRRYTRWARESEARLERMSSVRLPGSVPVEVI